MGAHICEDRLRQRVPSWQAVEIKNCGLVSDAVNARQALHRHAAVTGLLAQRLAQRILQELDPQHVSDCIGGRPPVRTTLQY